MSKIRVEVAFALPQKQQIIALDVEEPITAEEAVALSKIADQFQGQNVYEADLGVFGKSVKRNQVLRDGDRVEIYRPLIADPKEVRKARAAKAAKK